MSHTHMLAVRIDMETSACSDESSHSGRPACHTATATAAPPPPFGTTDRGAPFSEIHRENVAELMAYGFWYKSL